MSIEISELENSQLNVHFEADAQMIEDAKLDVLHFIKNNYEVKGFRLGKAPIEAIKFQYKNKINEITKDELTRQAYNKTIAEKNIKAFGQPQFSSVNFDGSKFTCEFIVNKIPDVELGQYKGFDLPKGSFPNSIEMAERILQELRHRHADTIPFNENDFLQKGDTAIVNYEAFLENSELSLKKDGELFVVGNSDIDAFNEQILGMKVGEKRQFNAILPPTATPTEIVGKQCKFEVELMMASKSTPLPLNDEFAQKIGTKDVNALISMTQEVASNRVKELEKKHLTEQVANRLLASHDFELPNWLALAEAQSMAAQYGTTWKDLSDEQKEKLFAAAAKNVKLAIILGKIRDNEPEAQTGDEEVLSLIKSNVGKYKTMSPLTTNKSDEEVLDLIAAKGYLPVLAATIRDDYVIDWIIKNSNIVE